MNSCPTLVLLLIIQILFWTPLLSYGEDLHGTINVLLANGNGLVVETDSRLSFGGLRRGKGQKLFKIDDKTVCAIAGFYSDPGPRFDDYGYPVYTSIPNLVETYLAHYSVQRNPTIEKKLYNLADLFIWGLERVLNVDKASGVPFAPTALQLTIAGVDGEQVKIGRIDLIPVLEGGTFRYRPANFSVKVMPATFSYSLAGMSDVAEKILRQPQDYPNEPIILKYAKLMATDGGKSLTLDDLRKIADYLKFISAFNHPAEVGDDSEVAVLSEGRVALFEQPVPNLPKPPQKASVHYEYNLTFRGSREHPGAIGLYVSPTAGELITNSHFSDVQQPLDNIIFSGTTFERCRLTYGGSPMTLFDETNVIVDSQLELGPAVGEENPFVVELKRRYPALAIVERPTKYR
jgi:hypothetical protein